ncbi:MAG: hypothetical protein AAB522_02045, partial [Patescibacteria group bacterium]
MQYKYIARTADGKENQGVVEAASLDLAVSSLQRKNLIIISVNPIGKESANFLKFFSGLEIFSNIKTQDVVLFSRELATLFEAKVPIVNSLNIIVS